MFAVRQHIKLHGVACFERELVGLQYRCVMALFFLLRFGNDVDYRRRVLSCETDDWE